jgi:hypothetical protein
VKTCIVSTDFTVTAPPYNGTGFEGPAIIPVPAAAQGIRGTLTDDATGQAPGPNPMAGRYLEHVVRGALARRGRRLAAREPLGVRPATGRIGTAGSGDRPRQDLALHGDLHDPGERVPQGVAAGIAAARSGLDGLAVDDAERSRPQLGERLDEFFQRRRQTPVDER